MMIQKEHLQGLGGPTQVLCQKGIGQCGLFVSQRLDGIRDGGSYGLVANGS